MWSTAGFLCVLVVLTIPYSRAGDNDNFPSPKTWWAKRISSDLYTAGRLTERQIKYVADAGFGTIVSLFTFSDNYRIGDDRVLDTTGSRDVAERLGGLGYHVILQPGDKMATVETVSKFAAIMSRAAKPVILHCFTAQSASLIALNYLSQTAGLSSRDIYSRGALLGYNFAAKPAYRSLIETITGEPPLPHPPTPDVTIPAWNGKYWLIKPVYKNWYMAGQIQSNQAGNLSSMGIDDIINCRQRAVSGRLAARWPSQEEVVLLNVKDNTGTYVGTGRQSTERLLVTRIDPARPNEYISRDSTVNYQRENSLEYGDDTGYNARFEKTDMESKNLTYQQTPPDNSKHDIKGAYTPSSIKAYVPKWLAAGNDASVCVHSQSGYRAAVVTLISAAQQYDLDSAWAIERASQLGYPFDKEQGQPMVKLFREVLRRPGETSRLEKHHPNVVVHTPCCIPLVHR